MSGTIYAPFFSKSAGSDHEGILRNDVEFFQTRGETQDLFAGLAAAFVHLFEQGVVAGLGAEKDHAAAGAADQGEGVVGEAVHGVDAGFAPPLHIFAEHTFGKFPYAFFAHKKVVVVEFDAVGAPFFLHVADVLVHLFRRFPAPAGFKNGYDGAKRAFERAAHAAVVSECAAAQKGAAEVFPHGIKAVEVMVGAIRAGCRGRAGFPWCF